MTRDTDKLLCNITSEYKNNTFSTKCKNQRPYTYICKNCSVSIIHIHIVCNISVCKFCSLTRYIKYTDFGFSLVYKELKSKKFTHFAWIMSSKISTLHLYNKFPCFLQINGKCTPAKLGKYSPNFISEKPVNIICIFCVNKFWNIFGGCCDFALKNALPYIYTKKPTLYIP